MGINAGHLTYREGYVNPARPDAFGGYQWQIGSAMKPNDLFGIALSRPELFGDELRSFIETASQHLGMMVGFGGGVADPDNRVELDTRKDARGVSARPDRPHLSRGPAQVSGGTWGRRRRRSSAPPVPTSGGRAPG